MMDTVILLTLIGSALRATTPLLLAALGGLFSERSGVVNIALEGIILFGGLAAAISVQQLEVRLLAANPEANLAYLPWLGLVFAAIIGGFVGWIHAVISIRYKADQIISATAINLMAIGMPALILTGLYQNTTTSQPIQNRLPLWGPAGFQLSPLVYLAFILVPLVYFIVFKTPFGLRLRAVGEHPEAADSVGINVRRMRYYGVIISGVLAGLAGAYLSIGNLNQYVANMSGGRGFIALAALIFGKWHPVGVLGATLLFGAFQAAATLLGGSNLLPPTIVESIPFILTMLVLAGFIGRAIPPKAVGKPFDK
ncbi:MAG: ABC transporter permease [Trueperaceae bacterium]|nr:ABC transporter permease [Trueperaceae bacterium]